MYTRCNIVACNTNSHVAAMSKVPIRIDQCSWYGRHVRQRRRTFGCRRCVCVDCLSPNEEKEKMLDTAMVAKETNVWSIPLLKTLFVLFSVSAEI